MRPYGTPSKKLEEHDGFDKRGRGVAWLVQIPVKAKARRQGKAEVEQTTRAGTFPWLVEEEP